MLLLELGGIPHSLELLCKRFVPVSYTHLDVYKRQTLPFTAGPLWGTSSAAALRRRSSTASISLSVTAGVTLSLIHI